MHRMSPFSARLLAFLTIAGLLFSVHGQQDEEVVLPELDLETLEAETPYGTLQAQLAETPLVAEIGDGRAIGIAFASDVDMPGDQDEVVVRLYDRQQAAVFVGPIDDHGHASLHSVEGSDFEATVEQTMHDDAVIGTVVFGGETPIPFTADPASGVAGAYWVFGDEDSEILAVDWIVLPDGHQWGIVCLPPPPTSTWCVVRNLSCGPARIQALTTSRRP